jgi:hypothetical protein
MLEDVLVIEANGHVRSNSVIDLRLMHCCTLDFHSILSWYYARQGFTSPWRQVVVATRFFTVVRDTCEFSVLTLFHASLIVP